MATFEVAAGTDWIGTLQFGSRADRWRLDDFSLTAHLKAVGDDQVLIEMTDENGRLIIIDAITRRLGISVSWADLSALSGSQFEFDIMLVNKGNGLRERSLPYTLAITRGITNLEA